MTVAELLKRIEDLRAQGLRSDATVLAWQDCEQRAVQIEVVEFETGETSQELVFFDS